MDVLCGSEDRTGLGVSPCRSQTWTQQKNLTLNSFTGQTACTEVVSFQLLGAFKQRQDDHLLGMLVGDGEVRNQVLWKG